MITKSYNPYKNGRWYKFFIETTEGDYKITTSDIEGATITSSSLKLPAGYKILEKCFDIHATGAFTLNISLKSFGNDEFGVSLPAKTAFDYADIYLFCEKVND